ncbi:MAG: ATP-binding protein [Bacteroidia bacterium]|nr:ATP-binding protein [Bacteroidia bacterium]
MFLNKIKYSQYDSDIREWKLNGFGLKKINLIVGKNSAGKSKSLSIINGLSIILGENSKLPFLIGNYEVEFITPLQNHINYKLVYDKGFVVQESLNIGDVNYISRDADGEGMILSSSGNYNEFKVPENELISTRRDEKQYPYLTDLYDWARMVRIFHFGSDSMTLFGARDKTKKVDTEYNLKVTANIVDTFNRGVKIHGEDFKKLIIADFNSIGYQISDIDLGGLTTVLLQVVDNPNVEIIGLKVKESDLECWTEQTDMSNGMYRALSLIIQFNYYEFESISGCVLIDDIGEGLDFERSVKLIKLLINKVESGKNDIQLIMSTNDRFVMNNVDLKYWQIINRSGPSVNYYNEENSKKIFEQFKYSGLSKFDFFATDFFKTGFDSEEE